MLQSIVKWSIFIFCVNIFFVRWGLRGQRSRSKRSNVIFPFKIELLKFCKSRRIIWLILSKKYIKHFVLGLIIRKLWPFKHFNFEEFWPFFKISRGHNFWTIRDRELQFAESSFVAKSTLGANFHANPRWCGYKSHFFWTVCHGMPRECNSGLSKV